MKTSVIRSLAVLLLTLNGGWRRYESSLAYSAARFFNRREAARPARPGLAPPPSAPAAALRPLPVVLTTDCGADIDDQWALAYLLASPQIRLLGVVSTHAPGLTSSQSAACARGILRLMRVKASLPVFPGANHALTGDQPHMNAGVRFLIHAARGYSRQAPLTVLTIGATTDVGSALLEAPGIARRIRIITMGFDRWPQGGDPWNIKNDPRAYQIILRSAAPLAIGSTSVCKRYLTLDGPQVDRLMGRRGRIGRALAQLFHRWFQRHPRLTTREAGRGRWVIWDTIVVARLLGYTRARSVPRPGLDPRTLAFTHPPTRRHIQWITTVQSRRMWANYAAKLDGYRAALHLAR